MHGPVNVKSYSSIRFIKTDTRNLIKVKVKQSRNRPGVAQRVPGDLGSQIS
jgi:hypothetical protein